MNANASIPWEQFLWDNTERHCEPEAALIRKPPGMPSAPQLEELGQTLPSPQTQGWDKEAPAHLSAPTLLHPD